ncbi:hypothetical protein MVEN_01147100 [Mycena venus]|uniref:Uncharacterized protein n=1 Tax=Mycena venus TaxID=2733690 RepID=A0A8H6Y0M5_9AGAR|nr:hypothetical protein MVEN_01147100 [Mycena venus]
MCGNTLAKQAPLDRPSIVIQASPSGIAYVRSGPRHSKRAAASYHLRCARYSVLRTNNFHTASCTILSLSSPPTRARTPSASQESRGRERALATIFSSTAVRTAESCVAFAARGTIYSTSHPTTWKPPFDLATPTRSTTRRHCLPAHRGSSAAYCRHRTMPDACACRTPLHRLHHLQRVMVVPHRRRRFYASSRAECVSSKYHVSSIPNASSIRHARPLRAQHLRHLLPIARAAVIASPPTFFADAGDCSKPRATAHRKHHPPILCAQHTLRLSPHRPILFPLLCPSPASYRLAQLRRPLPITSAGCVCHDYTTADEQRINDTEAMCTPCRHSRLTSALGIRVYDDGPVQRQRKRTALCAAPGISDRTASHATGMRDFAARYQRHFFLFWGPSSHGEHKVSHECWRSYHSGRVLLIHAASLSTFYFTAATFITFNLP